MNEISSIVPFERVAQNIYLFRGQKVMLDSDLADLYGVTTARLNEQVKRNSERFPDDFAFQLTDEEFAALMSQIAISNTGRGGRRKSPWVFTEHGILMLSSVLRSSRAADVNIAIMRTFVRMREVLATHKDVARKIEEHDQHIAALYDYVRQLMAQEEQPKNPIGYIKPKEK